MNQEHIDMTDELLIKYLLGEVSSAERASVTKWLAAAQANQKHFEDFKAVWELTGYSAMPTTVTADDAWARFTQRKAQQPADQQLTTPLPSYRWLRIAAGLLLLVACGLTAWLLPRHTTTLATYTTSTPVNNKVTSPVTPPRPAAGDAQPKAVIAQKTPKNTKKKYKSAKKQVKTIQTGSLYATSQKITKDNTIAIFIDDCPDNIRYHGPKYDANF